MPTADRRLSEALRAKADVRLATWRRPLRPSKAAQQLQKRPANSRLFISLRDRLSSIHADHRIGQWDCRSVRGCLGCAYGSRYWCRRLYCMPGREVARRPKGRDLAVTARASKPSLRKRLVLEIEHRITLPRIHPITNLAPRTVLAEKVGMTDTTSEPTPERPASVDDLAGPPVHIGDVDRPSRGSGLELPRRRPRFLLEQLEPGGVQAGRPPHHDDSALLHRAPLRAPRAR